MRVHVSLHDVSPAFAPELEQMLALTREADVRPALLVVPDFHGGAPLARHPDFVERLRRLQEEGHEIYLHGFFHRARPTGDGPSGDGRPRGLRRVFAQRVVSGGEAEFSDVTRAEALSRLEEGERLFRDLGLRITGFIPPAWSMPPWLLGVLAARGYGFTEDHLRVYDPAHGRTRASVVLNYASRSTARMLSTVAWCRAAKHAGAVLPARIALHPKDTRHPLLVAETRRLLAWGRGHFAPTGSALLA